MDAIGCVIAPDGAGKYDVYRIKLVDGKLVRVAKKSGTTLK